MASPEFPGWRFGVVTHINGREILARCHIQRRHAESAKQERIDCHYQGWHEVVSRAEWDCRVAELCGK